MNGYATFKDNSFMIPVGLMVDNEYSISLFTTAGTYVGDFLHEELKGAKV